MTFSANIPSIESIQYNRKCTTHTGNFRMVVQIANGKSEREMANGSVVIVL